MYRTVDNLTKKYSEKEVEKSRNVLGSMEKAKEVLRRLADYTGMKLFEKYSNILPHLILNIIRGNMLISMMLPLHLCLVKYYDVTRYPEGEVPKEEYEAISNVIGVLENTHDIVKKLVSSNMWLNS